MKKRVARLTKSNLESIVKKVIKEESHFSDMEVAFGVKHKHDNLSDTERNQFGNMLDPEDAEKDSNIDRGSHPGLSMDTEVSKEEKKVNDDYYKSVAKKMKDFQTSDKADELEVQNKYNKEDDEKKMYPPGSGMEGLRYDTEGTDRQDAFDDRIDDLNDGDSSYEILKDAGEEYEDYKYGDEKYDESEDEYQETPRVRTTKKESIENLYKDVIEENIFKTKGKIVNEEQVVKLLTKIPNRVKVDESVFAITDGDNFYRFEWQGDSKDGEAVMMNQRNQTQVNESIEKMKHLWGYNPNDSVNTKKTVNENRDDIFKKLFKEVKK